jgi:hypothetical protein
MDFFSLFSGASGGSDNYDYDSDATTFTCDPFTVDQGTLTVTITETKNPNGSCSVEKVPSCSGCTGAQPNTGSLTNVQCNTQEVWCGIASQDNFFG